MLEFTGILVLSYILTPSGRYDLMKKKKSFEDSIEMIIDSSLDEFEKEPTYTSEELINDDTKEFVGNNEDVEVIVSIKYSCINL